MNLPMEEELASFLASFLDTLKNMMLLLCKYNYHELYHHALVASMILLFLLLSRPVEI